MGKKRHHMAMDVWPCLASDPHQIEMCVKTNVCKSRQKGGSRGAKGTKAQCVELELRWQFCVHGSTCPEIYFYSKF